MNAIAPYYKAVTAIVVPFLTSIIAALLGTSDGGSQIMTNEWLTAVVVGLVAGGAVFAVPNLDPTSTHQAESVQPPHSELGAWETNSLLVAAACVVIIVVGVVWLIQAF